MCSAVKFKDIAISLENLTVPFLLYIKYNFPLFKTQIYADLFLFNRVDSYHLC